MEGDGNGLVVMKLTTGGGHLGWFQAGLDLGDRWTTQPVLEWFKLVGEDLVHDLASRGLPLYVDDNGFLKQEGSLLLGCKEVDGGGVTDGKGDLDVGMLQGL
jgi:hypothetical protein